METKTFTLLEIINATVPNKDMFYAVAEKLPARIKHKEESLALAVALVSSILTTRSYINSLTVVEAVLDSIEEPRSRICWEWLFRELYPCFDNSDDTYMFIDALFYDKDYNALRPTVAMLESVLKGELYLLPAEELLMHASKFQVEVE